MRGADAVREADRDHHLPTATRALRAADPVRDPEPGAGCLVAIYGPNLGRRWMLDRPELLIGRDESCDLVVPIETVSRRHCRLSVRPEGAFARDLGSTNGTWVEEEPVGSRSDRGLRCGDRLRLGGAIFRYLDGADLETLYHEEVYQTIVADGLTGAATRRHFFERLDREMTRCQRHRRPLALLVLDLDHFERVNDDFGHLSGDAALRAVADRIRKRVRPEDCFARTGGEAFALVLPETEVDAARRVAEELREAVGGRPFRVNGETIPVTISLGVATLESGMRSPDEFLEAADARLAEAKQAGRDRVRG
jgi:two-component system cell cycle response regulator